MWRWVATANFIGRVSVQRLMNTVLVVVVHERVEFSFKILGIPEEDMVQEFTTNRSDQSLHKGMRTRGIRDGLDLINVQNPQVGLPSVVQE